MAHLELVNISKRFGKTVAVCNASFKVYDKEFLVLLGPSGCGKTTLLRIIAGLETPDTGRVYIDGEDVTDLPPKDRDVAMVFQNYALYPHMKVYDIIAFPLKLRRYSKSEIDKRIKEIAKLLRIEDLLDRHPHQLSGGQQQRVALARALVRNPRVWLMDEPLSNLDALLRVQMRAELKRLQKEVGITTIYVTHDQVEAMTMADRAVVMNKGMIEQIGTPEEIYNNPRTIFVGGFIGSPPMNFIDAIFKQSNNEYLIEGEGFSMKLPHNLGAELSKKILTGTEIVVGIRPEDISITSATDENAIKGKIYVLEPLGSETIIDIKIGEHIIKVKYLGVIKADMGSDIYIKFNLNKIHIFDKSTGTAIM
ncbi:MAG: ABC transporter ATP-binding protein [Ignisphaera sp.]